MEEMIFADAWFSTDLVDSITAASAAQYYAVLRISVDDCRLVCYSPQR